MTVFAKEEICFWVLFFILSASDCFCDVKNDDNVSVVKRLFQQPSLASNSNSGQRKSVLDKFNVNTNTIIRTHDSRALGAKYLNESELPSNEDCLYWCWQTSPCNLAVYEEKVRSFAEILMM